MMVALKESLLRFRSTWVAAGVLLVASVLSAAMAKVNAGEANRLVAHSLQVEDTIRARERESEAARAARARAAEIREQLGDPRLPVNAAEAVSAMRVRLGDAGFTAMKVEVRSGNEATDSVRVAARAAGSYRALRQLLAGLEASPVPLLVRGFRFDGNHLELELESPRRVPDTGRAP